MTRVDQALSALTLAIGLILWPVIGWQGGIGVGLLALGIAHGIIALREHKQQEDFAKLAHETMLQTIKDTTERIVAPLVKAYLEHILSGQQIALSNPGEKGH